MVSFIIPVYNSENTIQRCIDSILSQTCKGYEIIAVNDCSQDESKLRLEEYGEKIVLLENSKNKGVSATRNHALKEAHGDWITFVDSDDYVVPYFVESIEMAGRSDSDLLIWKTQTCYSGSVDWNEHKTRNMAVSYYPHDSFGLGGVQVTPYLHGKVFRRSVIEKAGISFNEKMSMGEDSLFIKQYLSAMKQGFVQSEDVAYFYTRDNENSLSRKYYDNLEYCYSEIYDALKEMEKRYPNFQVNSGKKKMIAAMVIQNLYADSCNLSRRQRIATISRYMSDLETKQQMTEYVLSRMDLIRKVLFQINNPWLLDAVFSMGKKLSKKIKKS